MNKKNKSPEKIATITKCSICGKMFKTPLAPDEVRTFEISKELQLICQDCCMGKTTKRG